MPLLNVLCVVALAGQGIAPSTTVPFRLAEDAIIVDAMVNGRQVSLMFDTGFAGAVDVNEDVNIGKVTGKQTLKDFVGTFEADTVKINSLKLGDQTIDTKDLSEAIRSRGDFTASYGMHCDGIMGFDVIKGGVTGINYEKSRFEFYPKSVDISTWKPDNKRTFLCKLLPRGVRAMVLQVETPNGQTMNLALDTGNAFYATTHRDVLERVGLWDPGASPLYVKQSMVASGAVDSWQLRLKDMKIFGASVPSSVWDIIDLPSSSADGDGTVGYGFLHNFNIIVDYDRRRVWLDNYSGKFSDPEVGDSGIFAASDRAGNARVYSVAPSSPADKAGIKAGDTILSIDGVDLDTHLGFRRLKKLLEGPVDSKMSIALSHGGNLLRLKLDRPALVNTAKGQSR